MVTYNVTDLQFVTVCVSLLNPVVEKVPILFIRQRVYSQINHNFL